VLRHGRLLPQNGHDHASCRVAVYTILGGMLSVLVTDFLQFVVMSVGLIAVTVLVLYKVGWSGDLGLVAAVTAKFKTDGLNPAGGFNPFYHPELGWTYVLSNLLVNLAAVLTWQTCIARLLAAKDTQTGRKVYTGTAFFFVCRWVIPGSGASRPWPRSPLRTCWNWRRLQARWAKRASPCLPCRIT